MSESLKTTWKYNYQNLLVQKLENLSSLVFVKEIESLLQKLPTKKTAALKCQLFHGAQTWLPHQNKVREGRKEWEQEGSVTQRLWWMWELTRMLIPSLPSCNPCIFISSPSCTSAPQSEVCESESVKPLPNPSPEPLEALSVFHASSSTLFCVFVSTLNFS